MRAFIAIDVPNAIKDKAYKVAKEVAEAAKAREVDKEAMHITLHFLGEISESQKGKIESAIDSIEAQRFVIEIKGLGFFGGKVPRVAIAKIFEGRDELKSLYNMLYGPIEKAGVALEKREFSPHLTLARIKTEKLGRREIEEIWEALKKLESAYKDFEFGSFLCERIVLKKSEFTGKGVIHTVLHEKILD
ncbi:MAG: RNA 2',3'-cyclic phosphodiesterase [Candidatus Micrarchaeia archaeon]